MILHLLLVIAGGVALGALIGAILCWLTIRTYHWLGYVIWHRRTFHFWHWKGW